MSGSALPGRMRPRMKSSISTGTSVIESSAAARHGEGLGVGERLEQPPSWASSVKTGRNETVMTSREKKSAGPTSLAASIMTCARGSSGRQPLEVLVRVLDHDDRRVHHGADGDRDAAEAHDVGADARARTCTMNGDQHADRQGEDGDQRAADVQQEDDADERDDRCFPRCSVSLQRVDGAVDQLGAVVDGARASHLRAGSGMSSRELVP